MIHIIEEISTRKDLLRELVLKDLKMRYSRPALGFLWSFLSPLLIVGIFYVVFSIILRVKIQEAPFLLYLMSAVFTWRIFQDSVLSSVSSLIDNKNLLRESKFPHYFIPLSIVLANTINFLPSLGILLCTAILYLKGLPMFFFLFPLVLAMHLLITVSASLMVSILYLKCRDIRYILDAALQMLFYLTPAFYSFSLIRDSFGPMWFKIYILNPFVGIVTLYRITILRGFYIAAKEIGISGLFLVPLSFALVIFLASASFYEKNKDTINDHLSY